MSPTIDLLSETAWSFADDEFHEIDSRDEQIEFLLRYAVLAPSGHNTQPWLFRIVEDGIDIFADTSRRLPAVDPGDRELMMSLGAAAANFRVAAAHFGYESTLLLPVREPEGGAAASVRIRETCDPDVALRELFPYIKKRRTNREAFGNDRIDPDALQPLLEFIDAHEESFHVLLPRDTSRAADLIAFADCLQMDDDAVRHELANWIRRPNEEAVDGILATAIGFPHPVAGLAHVILEKLNLGAVQARRDHNLAESAPMVVVVSADDDPASLIRAGHDLELFLLTITRAGLQYSFLNSPVQVEGLRDRVLWLTRSRRPAQLILRIGSGTTVAPPAPRRPLHDVIERN